MLFLDFSKQISITEEGLSPLPHAALTQVDLGICNISLILPVLLAQLLLESGWASGLLMTALLSKNEPTSHQFRTFSFPLFLQCCLTATDEI